MARYSFSCGIHRRLSSMHVPVIGGALALGSWQGVYVAEHRARPHRREIMLQFIGSKR
jgi:thiamine phosphate synthase YjbQ (UPF0047 family)